jgi:ribosomal protein L7/L12
LRSKVIASLAKKVKYNKTEGCKASRERFAKTHKPAKSTADQEAGSSHRDTHATEAGRKKVEIIKRWTVLTKRTMFPLQLPSTGTMLYRVSEAASCHRC